MAYISTLIGEKQKREIEELAKKECVSVAEIIRRAITKAYGIKFDTEVRCRNCEVCGIRLLIERKKKKTRGLLDEVKRAREEIERYKKRVFEISGEIHTKVPHELLERYRSADRRLKIHLQAIRDYEKLIESGEVNWTIRDDGKKYREFEL